VVSLTAGRSLATAMLAAIGASVCCVEPYRAVFIGLTVVFFGLAFRKLYLVPRACASGATCADPLSARRRRTVFWIAGILMLGLLAVPWIAPLFY